ncbi:hypothetical protein [Mycobacterium intracellulare]|nr:hypothetical protein [Mycobacterium intracellulare]
MLSEQPFIDRGENRQQRVCQVPLANGLLGVLRGWVVVEPTSLVSYQSGVNAPEGADWMSSTDISTSTPQAPAPSTPIVLVSVILSPGSDVACLPSVDQED